MRKLNLTEGSRFTYEYDFGDSWEHTLVLEKILLLEKGMKLPQCIKGKRVCPPEDVGGPWGYEGFLEALRDPQHEEHDSYLEWIGGEFNPEGFDLEGVNKSLHKREERDWPGSASSKTEDGQATQKPLFDPARWANLLTKDGDKASQALALRQDVVTFLIYLKENKVTGTQATGNLPRKVIEEITQRFVNPPGLETKIGDTIFSFHNEDDVWPLYFVHVLAQGADLINGGPSRRWRLTPAGENFLTLPAVVQVLILFSVWWYRVNWMIAYSYDIFGNGLPEKFTQTVASHLHALAVDEQILFDPFADQLIRAMEWTWPKQETDITQMIIRAAIQHMVINPLEEFGVFATHREQDNRRLLDIKILMSFSLTKFGLLLLESI